jgi:hypothetical protein
MKYTSTLLLSCFSFFTASSQSWKLTTHYSLGAPQEQMGSNIQIAHSFQAGILHKLPGQWDNFSVGLEMGLGLYAHKKVDQTFWFDANTSTVVPVYYNSNVFNVNLQTRYQILDEDRFNVVPYINAKAGLYNFYSNILIEDPADPDGCKPLDRKNLINDKTLYWSAGVGVQINPVIFSKHKQDSRVRIDISANTIRGGTIDYINTKNLMDATSMPEPGAKPLKAQFINVSTQQIHEHTIAQVYTSSLRMMEFRAGVAVLLGGKN